MRTGLRNDSSDRGCSVPWVHPGCGHPLFTEAAGRCSAQSVASGQTRSWRRDSARIVFDDGLSSRLRRVLYRAFNQFPDSRHAARQAGGHPLYSAAAGLSLRPVRPARATRRLHRTPALSLHVRRHAGRGPGASHRPGTRHRAAKPFGASAGNPNRPRAPRTTNPRRHFRRSLNDHPFGSSRHIGSSVVHPLPQARPSVPSSGWD